MTLRFQCKAAAVALGGTTFTHGLQLAAALGGTAVAPDEWAINLRGPTPGAAALYVVSAPTSASIVVAASGAAGTGDIFCWYNASITE